MLNIKSLATLMYEYEFKNGPNGLLWTKIIFLPVEFLEKITQISNARKQHLLSRQLLMSIDEQLWK